MIGKPHIAELSSHEMSRLSLSFHKLVSEGRSLAKEQGYTISEANFEFILPSLLLIFKGVILPSFQIHSRPDV